MYVGILCLHISVRITESESENLIEKLSKRQAISGTIYLNRHIKTRFFRNNI